MGNIIKNPFTRTLSDQPIYVLLSTLSVMWTAGFQNEAKLLSETERDKIPLKNTQLVEKNCVGKMLECFETYVMVSNWVVASWN